MPIRKLKPLHFFMPITRVDEEQRIVEGYAFVNEVVEGEGGIQLRRSAMEAATPDYLKWGAVRAMHQPLAAGTASAPGCGVEWDEKGAYLRAKIVDDQEWKKVTEGVYKGFSVGVIPRLMRGKAIEKCVWAENSLVDRPKDPGAVITAFRAEGFDMDTEVDVECEDEEEPVERGEGMPVDTGALRVVRLLPVSAGSEWVEGENFVRVAAQRYDEALDLLRSEGPEAVISAIERLQTSETVPSRENLEGRRLHGRMHYDCGNGGCHGHLQHAAAVRCAEAANNRAAVEALNRCCCGSDDYGVPLPVGPGVPPAPRTFASSARGALNDHLLSGFKGAGRVLQSTVDELLLTQPPAQARELIRRSVEEYADYLLQLIDAQPDDAALASELRAEFDPEAQVARVNMPTRENLDPSYDPKHPEECCPHCGACQERSSDGQCNRCGKDWPENRSAADWPENQRAILADLQRLDTLATENGSLLTRVETLTTELQTAQAELATERQQRTAAEERVAKLERAAAPGNGPVRFPQALERDFLTNRGKPGEQAEITAQVTQYQDLQRQAQAEKNDATRQGIVERMLAIKGTLRERGIHL